MTLTFDMPGSPVAIDEAPGAVDADRRPRVSESISVQIHPRLVASSLGVALNHLTVKPSVTAGEKI